MTHHDRPHDGDGRRGSPATSARWPACCRAAFDIVAVEGRGAWLTDVDGRRFLDLTMGIAVNNVGHCHPRVVAAARAQLRRLDAHVGHGAPPAQRRARRAARRTVPVLRRAAGVLLQHRRRGGRRRHQAGPAHDGPARHRRLPGRASTAARSAPCRSRPPRASTATATSRCSVASRSRRTPTRCATGATAAATAAALDALDELLALQSPPSTIARHDRRARARRGRLRAGPRSSGSRACASAATATASCSCSTRCRPASAAPADRSRPRPFGVRPDVVLFAKGVASGLPLGGIIACAAPCSSAGRPRTHGTTFGGNPVSCAAALATLDVLDDERPLRAVPHRRRAPRSTALRPHTRRLPGRARGPRRRADDRRRAGRGRDRRRGAARLLRRGHDRADVRPGRERAAAHPAPHDHGRRARRWPSPYWGVPSPPTPELAALAAIVGADHVVDRRRRAGRLRGRLDRSLPRAMPRPSSGPATVDEVAAVVAWCAAHGVAVVPQGGNTGLVGGGVPVGAAAAPSCAVAAPARPARPRRRRSPARSPPAPASPSPRCTPTPAAAGWAFGVDLAARDSATVGGMVATNAGGRPRRCATGRCGPRCSASRPCSPTARVVRHLDGLVKDNTGYDLAGLLVGSEGTLGVVTAARLRLVPRAAGPRSSCWRPCPPSPRRWRWPPSCGARCPGSTPSRPCSATALDLVRRGARPARRRLPGDGGVGPARRVGRPASRRRCASPTSLAPYPRSAAADAAGRARLWRYRERMPEAIARVGVPHKLDVTLPAASWRRSPTRCRPWSPPRAPARVYLFGHLGDGNLHVNIIGVDPDDDARRRRRAAPRRPTTAEHQRRARHRPGQGAVARPVDARPRRSPPSGPSRRALDPAGILNPGVLL